MRGITFIGMAGAGKSSVGRIVGEILNWRVVDLDKLILQAQGMNHNDYMKKFGEQALSDLEQKLTLDLNFDNTVFSPPGSMVYSGLAMDKIKRESIVIYLNAPPEIIQKRMGDRLYKNGIIGLKEKGLSQLMQERAVYYERYADYTFESGDHSARKMAETVLFGLQKAGLNLKKNAISQHQ